MKGALTNVMSETKVRQSMLTKHNLHKVFMRSAAIYSHVRQRVQWGLFVIGASLLSACSTGPLESDGAYRYVDEQQARRDLAIPPGLVAVEHRPLLSVPNIQQRGLVLAPHLAVEQQPTEAAQPSVPAKPVEPVEAEATKTVNASADNAPEQQPTGQHSLVVNGNKADIWNQLLAFWQAESITLAVNNSQQGIMRTEWRDDPSRIADDFVTRIVRSFVEALYTSDYRDQYVVRVEPLNLTAEPEQSRIHLVHYGTQQQTTYDVDGDIDNTDWVPRPADTQHAIDMLNKIVAFLGADVCQQPDCADNHTAPKAVAPLAQPVSELSEPEEQAEQAVKPAVLEVAQEQPIQPEAEQLYMGSRSAWMRSLYPEPHRQQAAQLDAHGSASAEAASGVMLQQAGISAGALYIANTLPMAWTLLGKALQHPDFKVQHQNPAEGLFLVEYPATQGIGQQLLSKLVLWQSEDKPAGTQQYQIVLQPHASGSVIQVLDTQGNRIRGPRSAHILNRLAGYFQPMK